jgi:folate-binding protein YgfZ
LKQEIMMSATPLLARHEALGAHMTEEAGWQMPADFGDPAVEHLTCRKSAIVMDLSHRGKIRIAGSDAVRFLHGMLSNQVEGLHPGEGAYTTFLTRQGKFVVDLNLYRREEDLAADLAPGMASVFAEAMDMYIIMDEVEIEDWTNSRCALGIFGPDSRETVSKAGLEVPSLPHHGHVSLDGVLVSRELWTGEDGYLITAPADRAESIWEALSGAGARPAGLTALDTLTLEAGIPQFGKDMDANMNPMQAGLELTAIDFDKGCYIGQEVIAKIKYLGQVNRGLAGIRLEGGIVPAYGDPIAFEGSEVGTITRSAFGPALKSVMAFGFLHRKAMAPGTPLTVQTEGTEISGEVVALPFYQNQNLVVPDPETAS